MARSRPSAPLAGVGTVLVMIGFLHGVVRHSATGQVLVDVSGVGYVVHTPTNPVVGTTVELWVSTLVREDAITLYGFATLEQQATFDALRAVSGIGPGTAVSLLRELGDAEIHRAVHAKDSETLTRVRGVGEKAAVRIITMVKLPEQRNGTETAVITEIDRDALAALETLGYSRGEARVALSAATAAGADTTETLITFALEHLRQS